jgi:hypothetical protein
MQKLRREFMEAKTLVNLILERELLREVRVWQIAGIGGGGRQYQSMRALALL